MASIKNLEGLTTSQINSQLAQGAKFVMYPFAVSIVFMTFRRSSDIYFVRAGESAVLKGLPFTFVSLVFGWWGVPWGPIYSIGSLYTNLRGGKDVTQEVLQSINTSAN